MMPQLLRLAVAISIVVPSLLLLPGRYNAASSAASNDRYRPHATLLPGDSLHLSGLAEVRRRAVTEADSEQATRQHTGAPVQEQRAFTDLLVHWRASTPPGASLTLEIRASADGTAWTEWGTVTESEDLRAPADAPGSAWSVPIYAGRSRFWQIRTLARPAPDQRWPVLHEIVVNTVDVGETPTQEQGLFQAVTTAPAPALPPLYTRVDWGSPDGQGSRMPPQYHPATHMVIHHTAGYNILQPDEFWWGDRVRAIWAFHTYSRQWGDIGYNFLIDPDGNLYEGRAGAFPSFERDPIGFHDGGNYGSMGVGLIGNYQQVLPTTAAQRRLAEVLAWKAAQRGIDPLGSSYYEGCARSSVCGNPGAITPNIASHRDVANEPHNYTACPGEAAYATLPGLRSQVSALLQGAPAAPVDAPAPPTLTPTPAPPTLTPTPAPPTATPTPTATPLPPTPTRPAARNIEGETHWTLANSPIFLDRDYQVPAGSSLTIDPGVEVRIAPGADFRVYGVLHAIGSPEAPVRFVASEGRWRGIYLGAGADARLIHSEIRGAGGEGLAIVAEGATLDLEHTLITDSGGGIVASGGDITMKHTAIMGNDFQSGGALALTLSEGQQAVLSGNLIAGNRTTPATNLAQITVQGPPALLQVEHNLLSSTSGTNMVINGPSSYTVHITCNTFSGGANGLLLRTEQPSLAGFAVVIRHNVFSDHQSRGAAGDLAFDLANNWWGDPSGPAQVSGNPSGLGDSVGVNIKVTPWLTERPACAPAP